MRAVIQRVTKSQVSVDDKIIGKIDKGLMVLLGVEDGDGEKDLKYMADKIIGLRIFEDDLGKMNLSLLDVKGDMLVVSQFTLLGDCRKGRRPGFTGAARPDIALKMYKEFISICQAKGVHVEEGVFQADMVVEIYNDGPVTLLLDSRKQF